MVTKDVQNLSRLKNRLHFKKRNLQYKPKKIILRLLARGNEHKTNNFQNSPQRFKCPVERTFDDNGVVFKLCTEKKKAFTTIEQFARTAASSNLKLLDVNAGSLKTMRSFTWTIQEHVCSLILVGIGCLSWGVEVSCQGSGHCDDR